MCGDYKFLCGSGWGTDEQAVIYILAHRDAAQRKLIRLAYEEKYNESLTQRLQSELSGDFQVTKHFYRYPDGFSRFLF
jgi:hypothetical protein